VSAPFDGLVLDRQASPGQVVEAGRTMFTIADLSRLILRIDLGERDYQDLDGRAARVLFQLDDRSGRVFRGKLLSAGIAVDPATRVVRAQAEVKGAAGGGGPALLPGMFGKVEIAAGEREEALLVPRAAVQWEGCHHIVFVEQREGQYGARAVELGREHGDFQEVRAGLVAGERVVTTGSYLLKTEVLKGSIGAGCCE
jgi:cobalt-zinc-cadmium efflux system membrane fusion protein